MSCMRRAPDVCGGRAAAAVPLYPGLQHHGKSLMIMSSHGPLLKHNSNSPYRARPEIASPVHRHAAAAYAVKQAPSQTPDQVLA